MTRGIGVRKALELPQADAPVGARPFLRRCPDAKTSAGTCSPGRIRHGLVKLLFSRAGSKTPRVSKGVPPLALTTQRKFAAARREDRAWRGGSLGAAPTVKERDRRAQECARGSNRPRPNGGRERPQAGERRNTLVDRRISSRAEATGPAGKARRSEDGTGQIRAARTEGGASTRRTGSQPGGGQEHTTLNNERTNWLAANLPPAEAGPGTAGPTSADVRPCRPSETCGTGSGQGTAAVIAEAPNPRNPRRPSVERGDQRHEKLAFDQPGFPAFLVGGTLPHRVHPRPPRGDAASVATIANPGHRAHQAAPQETGPGPVRQRARPVLLPASVVRRRVAVSGLGLRIRFRIGA